MITRYHNLECPDCQRQKLVAVPSTAAFYCCRNWDVTVELQREGMLLDCVVTWTPKVVAPKKCSTRLPRGGVDVHSWRVAPNAEETAFVLVDEYDELVSDREFTSFMDAAKALYQVIIDEMAARQDHGPDR